MINRLLDLTSQKHSFFLFGPRQTGKTYLCQHTLQPDLYINLSSEISNRFTAYLHTITYISTE